MQRRCFRGYTKSIRVTSVPDAARPFAALCAAASRRAAQAHPAHTRSARGSFVCGGDPVLSQRTRWFTLAFGPRAGSVSVDGRLEAPQSGGSVSFWTAEREVAACDSCVTDSHPQDRARDAARAQTATGQEGQRQRESGSRVDSKDHVSRSARGAATSGRGGLAGDGRAERTHPASRCLFCPLGA
jgi:hypothetical protein